MAVKFAESNYLRHIIKFPNKTQSVTLGYGNARRKKRVSWDFAWTLLKYTYIQCVTPGYGYVRVVTIVWDSVEGSDLFHYLVIPLDHQFHLVLCGNTVAVGGKSDLYKYVIWL